MKNLFYTISLFTLLLFAACNNQSERKNDALQDTAMNEQPAPTTTNDGTKSDSLAADSGETMPKKPEQP